MKININEATAKQIAAWASVAMGLQGYTAKHSKEAMIGKLRAIGIMTEMIDVDDEEEQAPPAPKASDDAPIDATPKHVAKEGRTIIMIHAQQEVGGSDPVFIGCNGVGVRVSRGVRVAVPNRFVEVLDHAQKTIFDKNENGTPINPRKVHQYPFSIFGPEV